MRLRQHVRPSLLGLVGVLALALVWEACKALGPADGWRLGDVSVLPRTTDLAMLHVWEMVARAFEPVRNGSDDLGVQAVLAACVPPDTAYDTTYVEHALANLEEDGVDVTGADFAPLEVTLEEGGQ